MKPSGPICRLCRLPAAAAWILAAGLWLDPAPARAAAEGGVTGPVVALLVVLAAVFGAAGGFVWQLHRGAVLRRALELVPHPRQVVSSRGHCLYANPAFRDAFGATDRPMPEALAEGAADQESQAEVRRLVEAAAQGGAGCAEVRLAPAGASGTGVWRHVAAGPAAGRPGAVLWALDDTKVERRAEQVVRAEQQRCADMLDAAQIGFYALDAEGRFVFANPALAEWLGLAREELEGRLCLRDVLAHELPEAAAPGDVLGGGAERGEATFAARGGMAFPALVGQAVERHADGRVLGSCAVVRNLSEDRAMAAELIRAERRFGGFFERAPVGIALLDGEGLVTECNDAVREIGALADKAVAAMPLAKLVAEQSQPLLEDLLDRAGPSNLVDDGSPVEVKMADGETVCALYLTPIDHEADKPGGYVAHFIDTTEQKSLERQFVQSQKMQAVGQLAGGIAHDFNNLLTAMIGFSDLLLLRHGPGDQSFADIMQIKQNANRAANLVRQLLAFSRQQTLQAKVLNLTDILAELSHLLRRLIGETIDLKMVHGRDLGMIKADEGQLVQVIMNLAVNARDAMPEGGTLTIQTDNVHFSRAGKRRGETVPAGGYNQITVSDSGCGVAREDLDRIFDPFFTTKEVGAGTGLGLSTVYGIVKQTGGFVFVDSKPGVGTTFTILLPHHVEADKAEAEPVTQDAPRDDTGDATLLLVEDEDAVRAFSARALRSKGYKVLEARSGEAALELLSEQKAPIDLLITDVVMPRIDGPALVRRVRGERPDLKVIFISGYAEDAFRKRLDQGAGIHFLPKPFSLKQLAGKVKEVMRESAA